MREFKRKPAPIWLKDNYKKWGLEWENEFAAKKKFSWNRKSGATTHKIDQKLKPLLIEQTQRHCSFCDSFPMEWTVPAQIEHFKPKNKFFQKAYKWQNLFLICSNCNSIKSKNYKDLLLKPDSKNYCFDDYFEINCITFELQPNPEKSLKNQERAKYTIEIYGLNQKGRCNARKLEVQKYFDSKNPNINEFSYRSFIEAFERRNRITVKF